MTRGLPVSGMSRHRTKTDRGERSLVGELQHSHRFTFVALAVMVLVSLLSSGYLIFDSQPKVARYVEMTRDARDAHEAMLDQETGLRGWLATGDPVFLQPYRDGRTVANQALEELLASAQGDPAVTDAVVAMLLTRERWNGWANRAAHLHATRAQRDDGELTAFLLQGKRLFDTYRAADERSTSLVRERRTDALTRQQASLVVVLAIYLLVLVTAGYLAVRRRRIVLSTVVGPFGHLLDNIESIRQGDLKVRSAPTRVDELDRIGSALDGLAADLERAREEAATREQRLAYLASRFETVVTVGREIAGSLSIRYVAETVTLAAADLLQAPATLWTRGEGHALVAVRRSQDPRTHEPPADLPAPEVVLTTSADARVCVDEERRAYPLVLGGTVVGVLETAATTVDAETEQVLEALLSTSAAALESAHLHSSARELADLDGLTHLPNRRRFEADIDAEWERCRRYGRPMSVVMLDLDHFKRLNDDHGHLVGDQVLREVAEAVTRVLRTSDTAYRYGGEELVVMLRETALDDGLAVAERIRAALTDVRIPGTPGVTVTCSAGVAERLSGMAHHNELIAVADAALYDAKRQGRNRVVAATLEQPTALRG